MDSCVIIGFGGVIRCKDSRGRRLPVSPDLSDLAPHEHGFLITYLVRVVKIQVDGFFRFFRNDLELFTRFFNHAFVFMWHQNQAFPNILRESGQPGCRGSFGSKHSLPSDLERAGLVDTAIVFAVARGAPLNIAESADFAQKDRLSEIAYFHNQSNSLHASVEVQV